MAQKPPDSAMLFLIYVMISPFIIVYYLARWLCIGLAALCAMLSSRPHLQHFSCASSLSEELAKVDSMDGIAFEYYCQHLLEKNGYKNVKVTPASGDYGADVIASFDKQKYAIQCKCYANSLGIKCLQEVYSAKAHYNADFAVVLTNSLFTANSIKLAKDTGVLLWDRQHLSSLITNAALISSNQTANGFQKQDLPVQSLAVPLVKSNVVTVPHAGLSKAINTKKESYNMATTIHAGVYVFNEDIPSGKYDLKVISGNGMLKIKNGDDDDMEQWLNFGLRDGFAKEFKNLSLRNGWHFSLDGDLVVEISKSKMIIVD